MRETEIGLKSRLILYPLHRSYSHALWLLLYGGPPFLPVLLSLTDFYALYLLRFSACDLRFLTLV